MNLLNAALGEKYTVCNISDKRDMKLRLCDLGIIEGASIIPLFKSPFGEPTAYKVLGAVIALRSEDSECITVEKRHECYGTDC